MSIHRVRILSIIEKITEVIFHHMCVYKRYIVNAIGKRVLVNCGHCPACLQSKAIQKSNKIRSNFPDSGESPLVALFVTLTYANDYIPYIRPSEVDLTEVEKISFKREVLSVDRAFDGMLVRSVNVYRDRDCRYVRTTSKKSLYAFRKKSFLNNEVLTSLKVSDSDWLASCSSLVDVRNKHGFIDDKVGVIYYKDVQDFVKRLRSNLAYRGYQKYISVFQCSEYGPRTCRPHFHLLIFCSSEDYKLLSSAIVQAWPYDDGFRTRKNIEIARNASSYVASYVNCSSFVPQVFTHTKPFRPKSTCSKGFGMALKCFSLCQVFEAYKRGDLSVNVWRYRNKSVVVDNILLPKYVLNRYFPKIKGYSRLSVDALQSICKVPYTLYRYGKELDYKEEDYSRNLGLIRCAASRFLDAGLSLVDFADSYSHIWALRASQTYGREVEEIDCINSNFYAYDNIADYFSGDVISPSLDDVFSQMSVHPIVNPNEFPKALQRTFNLEKCYYAYSKDKEVRNLCLSQTMHI